MDLKTLTIKEARQLLLKREISSKDLTAAQLGRIRERNPEIHAFLDVYEDEALEAAKRVDKEIQNSKFKIQNSSLVGIPGAVKDNILIKGHRSTAGSRMLEEYIAPYDAAVTRKLRDAGAIFLGKTNLDEFAMGSSTENSAFGPTKNPYDFSRVPGGSSGGSAAAVADGMALWALGSDTGGSIRQPAGFCGVVGLKPTYGAVSRYGLIAMASSLDQIGPFTKTVQDAAIVFEAIVGRDEMDSTSNPQADYAGLASEITNYQLPITKLRVGVPKEYFSAGGGPASGGAEGMDATVEQVVRSAIAKLEELGADIREISLPHTSYALPCYYIIQPAEVSANLARYDGIRYSMRINADQNQRGSTQINPRKSALSEQYFATRGEGFGREVRRRILLGAYVLSAGYYDAYYAKAQKVRRLIRDDFVNAFNQVDVILAPTSPTLPFQFGERAKDPLAMYLADIYTVPTNLAGVPALSLPYGRIGPRIHADVNADQRGNIQRQSASSPRESAALPVGIQIIGKHFDEKTILQVGDLLEQS